MKVLKSQTFKILVVIAIVTCTVYGLAIGLMAIRLKGKVSEEVFNKTDEYKIENTIVFDVKEGEDFKILNLADIQFNDFLDLDTRDITFKTIEKLIEREKPNLITMTGDQVWAGFKRQSLRDLIKFMDKFEIPWAPVMGNHESDGNCDRNWVADRFIESEYCVFKKGPNNIEGVGNYIINITSNKK